MTDQKEAKVKEIEEAADKYVEEIEDLTEKSKQRNAFKAGAAHQRSIDEARVKELEGAMEACQKYFTGVDAPSHLVTLAQCEEYRIAAKRTTSEALAAKDGKS